MDMRQYAGTNYLNLDDFVDGPRREIIEDVQMGDYGRPDLYFKSGDRLSVNVTNSRTLIRAFGYESDGWKNKAVELYVGEIEFKGKPQESVLVRPITPPAQADGAANGPRPTTKTGNAAVALSSRSSTSRSSVADDLDDEIPL